MGRVMIDLATEQLLTFSQAAARLPSDGSRGIVDVSTVRRWATRGVRGVQLEAIRIGGMRYTSVEALRRFAEAIEHGPTNGGRPRRRNPRADARRDAELDATLTAAGW